MSVSLNLLQNAVVDLFEHEKSTLHGRWWTIESIILMLERRYDFQNVDLNKAAIAKAIKKIDGGNLSLKKQANPSGWYVHQKSRTNPKGNHNLVCRSTHDTIPMLPRDKDAWNQLWSENDKIIKNSGALLSIKPFSGRGRTSRMTNRNYLTEIDHQLELMRQKQLESSRSAAAKEPPTTPAASRENSAVEKTPATTTAASAVVTPDPPPSVSFWKSTAARSLFGPRPDQSTEQHLQDAIDLFLKVENDIRCVHEILDGGEDAWEEMNDYQRQRVAFKIRCLRVAYETALSQKDNGWTWTDCCKYSIDQHQKHGITTWKNARSAMDWNKEFRRNHLFSNPLNKREKQVQFFSLFPEGRNMLYDWAKSNLDTLSSEGARRHLVDEVFPTCIGLLNEELSKHDIDPVEWKGFLQFVGLKSLDVSTVWRWLKLIGFSYDDAKKCYYTDNHERPDNVAARKTFIYLCFELEKRAYRWVQLTADEAKELESLPKHPLKKDSNLCREHVVEEEGAKIDMRECHVDCHPSFDGYIKDCNKKFGGNLSHFFPTGSRPII